MYEALKQTKKTLFCFEFVLDLFWNCFALFCFSCKSRLSHWICQVKLNPEFTVNPDQDPIIE